MRAYLLRVTIDGKKVFEGENAKTLGYVDLDFPATAGQKVRIELVKPAEDRDAFGSIIELKTDREAHGTGAEKVPTGWRLSIIEADILGPVK